MKKLNMNKRKFILSKIQATFLIDNFLSKPGLNFIQVDILKKNKIYNNNFISNMFYLEMSKKEQEFLLDSLTFLLTSEGIDENSEINDKGLLIESIIDIISPYKE